MNLIKINHKEYGLESTKAQQISDMFVPMLNKMTDLESEYNDIISLPIDEKTCGLAKDLRVKYSKIRTSTAAIHKDLKAFYLKGGRFVDGWKNAQKMASDGIEKKLLSIEKHFENIKKEKQTLLRAERLKELEKYDYTITTPFLGEMEESVWVLMIKSIKTDYEDKFEAEKKAIELKKEQERAEAEKRIKIQEENRLLKIRADEKQAEIDKQQVEIDRIKREEQIKLQAEIDKQQADLDKGDKEKIVDLIDDLNKVSKKFKFESEKNKKMFSDVNTLLFKVINHIEKTQRGIK